MEPPTGEHAHLLCHLPSYRVLICTQCRYAIQPSAIARHLKDIHRIPSRRRRPLVEYGRALVLADPADVPSPAQTDFPVPHLPVTPGWRCEAPGCAYLCVSSKRMEMHWSSVHRAKGSGPASSVSTCSSISSSSGGGASSAVPLQTFFRGNMLRYFAGPPTLVSHGQMPMPQGYQERQHQQAESHTQPPCSTTLLQKRLLIDRHGLQGSDVEALDHYWASTYDKTFPVNSEGDARQTRRIWLHIAPAMASEHRFVLEGILAAAYLHLAHLEPQRRPYLVDRSVKHLDAALPAFRDTITQASSSSAGDTNGDAVVVFAHMLLAVTMASDAVNARTEELFIVHRAATLGTEEPPVLPQWLHFLRTGCSMLFDVCSHVQDRRLQSLIADILSQVPPDAVTGPRTDKFFSFIPRGDHIWSEHEVAVYKEAALALAATLTEIDIARRRLAGLDVAQAVAFELFARWPIRLEDRALALLSRQHPGMLILLAHYCVCLKELDGYWYFRGRAAALLSSIEGMLPPEWHCCIEGPRSVVYNNERAAMG